MGNFRDLSDQRFGRLAVIKRAGKRKTSVLWECLCDCGKLCVVSSWDLVSGKTKSCGCLRSEIVTARNQTRFIANGLECLVRNYRNGATFRKLEFSLSREEFGDLISKNCFYCGSPPRTIFRKKTGTKQQQEDASFMYTGIDRTDNQVGYVIGNCVPCCITCNVAKLQMSLEDFRAWVIRVHEYWAKVSPCPADKQK